MSKNQITHFHFVETLWPKLSLDQGLARQTPMATEESSPQ
jgi:hypothetical protein